MRKLGYMGENVFALWCADAGLVANSSIVDETGWDFIVEFPFSKEIDTHLLHKAASECKVQVKATDKKDRKLAIKLSNLRRLATTLSPAFFVFIEFDGLSSAQRVFVVHVGKDLISRVLKRMHEIEQYPKENNFHKRTMVVSYDDTHLVDSLDGKGVRDKILSYIGDEIPKYIADKKHFLETVGYEDGCAHMEMTTIGEENLRKLIDVSVGVKDSVDVNKVTSVKTRFGIKDEKTTLTMSGGKLSMPDLEPNATGELRFKSDPFEPGLLFDVKLFISPFNQILPEELQVIRIDEGHFDMVFTPTKRTASFNLLISTNERGELKKLKSILSLYELFFAPKDSTNIEVFLNDKLLFTYTGTDKERASLGGGLDMVNAAVNLADIFQITDPIQVSYAEIIANGSKLETILDFLSKPSKAISIDFELPENIESGKDTACSFLVSARLGDYTLGIVCIITGAIESTGNERYKLESTEVKVEKKVVLDSSRAIPVKQINSMVKEIEAKYEKDYQIVTLIERSEPIVENA